MTTEKKNVRVTDEMVKHELVKLAVAKVRDEFWRACFLANLEKKGMNQSAGIADQALQLVIKKGRV